MTNQIITDRDGIEHIIIDRGNAEFTSMPKSVYESQQAQQVEHLTESVTKAK
jgi:hypothetical protein